MADDVTTDTQEQQSGGGFTRGASAIVGAGVGAVGTAQFLGKPAELETKLKDANSAKIELTQKYDAALLKVAAESPAHSATIAEHVNAVEKHTAAQTLHKNAVQDAWNHQIAEAGKTPDGLIKVKLAGLETQLQAVQRETSEASTLATKGLQAQIKAVKDLGKFSDVTAAETALNTTLETSWQTGTKGATDALRAEAGNIVPDLNKLPRQEYHAHLAKALPEADKAVKASAEVKATETALTQAETALKAAKEKMAPAEKAAREAVGAEDVAKLATAESTAARLEHLKGVNAAKGIGAVLKRPVSVWKGLGTGGKTAIVAGTVALGAIGYGIARSFTGRENDRRVDAAGQSQAI